MIASFFAAWQFLTIFPKPHFIEIQKEDISISAYFFPVVGLVIGVLFALADLGLRQIFPSPVAAICDVIFLLFCSGALHADGLADTADGFLSSRPRERILEIMRDSRSGPMAILALFSVLALKYTALSSFSTNHFWLLILIPVLSRWNLLLSMNLNPYARGDGGIASIFTKRYSTKNLTILAALLTLGSCASVSGVVILLVTQTFAFLFSQYCKKKIGGFTGDTLGACCEITEALGFLTITFMDKLHGV